ncbi:MAG: hypothetical protein HY744_19725 [Deltaproteobacteria bacterium]|nr:hypothetical protein [Deltaproteobacteria bacterium]
MARHEDTWRAALAAGALGALFAASAAQGACGGSDEDVHPTFGAGGTGASTGAGASGAGGGMTITTGGNTGTGGGQVECEEPCDPGEICSHGTCAPLETCKKDDDCRFDTYCDPNKGCLPWEQADPKHDPGCLQVIPAGVLAPAVQCEFSKPPPGDPFPAHVDVQGTPIVANFSQPPGSGPPSIAASFTATVPGGYTEHLGVIRVLSGKDCSLEANLGGVDLDGDNAVDWTDSPTPLAAGDLDADGVPEIVTYGSDGAMLAFTRKNGQWGLLWKAKLPPGAPWGPCCTWAGPSIHDLDDDGAPEVIRDGVVFSSKGQVLTMQPPGFAGYSQGLFPVLANLDQDPAIEYTNGQFVWQWQAGAWTQEAYFPGVTPSAPGHVAVADFGAYGTNVPPNAPELAVVRSGYAMVYAITGELAMPALLLPGGGTGGPPTASDFDGDGQVELAVAGANGYSVFDIDCGPSPRPGGICPSGQCDYMGGQPCPQWIAWSRQTQDWSSNITGSSIFDFEADGSAEVVYAAECFVRVYEGKSGSVLFSQYRSSCTWYENPIIADVDGDFRAELVTPSNKACSDGGAGIACSMLDGSGVDMQFAGLRCKTGADCPSKLCDAGLCRCGSGAQCCAAGDEGACLEMGYKCVPPPPGTPGSGNTCRAAHPHGVSGIRVYGDANDQWVKSRMIWNQHAYAVTHVSEDGTIPKTSAWKNNWDDPLLNNFRQNVPGMPNGNAIGDATAGASKSYACAGDAANLMVSVCNRGAAAIPPGVKVGFYVAGQKVCETETKKAIEPEACESVSCTWPSPPENAADQVDVQVVADDGDGLTECKEGNNDGVVYGVFCKPPS